MAGEVEPSAPFVESKGLMERVGFKKRSRKMRNQRVGDKRKQKRRKSKVKAGLLKTKNHNHATFAHLIHDAILRLNCAPFPFHRGSSQAAIAKNIEKHYKMKLGKNFDTKLTLTLAKLVTEDKLIPLGTGSEVLYMISPQFAGHFKRLKVSDGYANRRFGMEISDGSISRSPSNSSNGQSPRHRSKLHSPKSRSPHSRSGSRSPSSAKSRQHEEGSGHRGSDLWSMFSGPRKPGHHGSGSQTPRPSSRSLSSELRKRLGKAKVRFFGPRNKPRHHGSKPRRVSPERRKHVRTRGRHWHRGPSSRSLSKEIRKEIRKALRRELGKSKHHRHGRPRNKRRKHFRRRHHPMKHFGPKNKLDRDPQRPKSVMERLFGFGSGSESQATAAPEEVQDTQNEDPGPSGSNLTNWLPWPKQTAQDEPRLEQTSQKPGGFGSVFRRFRRGRSPEKNRSRSSPSCRGRSSEPQSPPNPRSQSVGLRQGLGRVFDRVKPGSSCSKSTSQSQSPQSSRGTSTDASPRSPQPSSPQGSGREFRLGGSHDKTQSGSQSGEESRGRSLECQYIANSRPHSTDSRQGLVGRLFKKSRNKQSLKRKSSRSPSPRSQSSDGRSTERGNIASPQSQNSGPKHGPGRLLKRQRTDLSFKKSLSRSPSHECGQSTDSEDAPSHGTHNSCPSDPPCRDGVTTFPNHRRSISSPHPQPTPRLTRVGTLVHNPDDNVQDCEPDSEELDSEEHDSGQSSTEERQVADENVADSRGQASQPTKRVTRLSGRNSAWQKSSTGKNGRHYDPGEGEMPGREQDNHGDSRGQTSQPNRRVTRQSSRYQERVKSNIASTSAGNFDPREEPQSGKGKRAGSRGQAARRQKRRVARKCFEFEEWPKSATGKESRYFNPPLDARLRELLQE